MSRSLSLSLSRSRRTLKGHYKSKSEVPMDDDEKGISGLLTED